MSSRREGRQIRPLRAREIRGQVVRGVRCASHGRNAQEARAGALERVPGVRTERGSTWDRPKIEINLEVKLGLGNPMSFGQRLRPLSQVNTDDRKFPRISPR